MSKVEIHCFPAGFYPSNGKCCHKTIATIVVPNGQQHVNTRYSTAEKWRPHDIGHIRTTNIAAWCGDFDASRQIYDQQFGKGGWTTVWHNENPFPDKMIIFR